MSVRNWEVGAWYVHADYPDYRAQVTHVQGTTAQVCLYWEEPYYPFRTRSVVMDWHQFEMKWVNKDYSEEESK